MKIGVCYYPEHWPVSRWKEDARLMREAGISIVRIAEFAWAKMEPEEGRYDWAWLDEAVETLHSAGHQVVLCTPTAAPPAWMMEAHPDMLPVDETGRRRRFGSRRHYCPTNEKYHEFTRKITQAMAQHYGNHPAVIGWQIDNEFGCYFARCYCESCILNFRAWLKSRYQSLDDLNESWGTIFWSQTYQRWSQIEPHNLTVAEPNPSHVLDFYRFSSDSWVNYQQLQIDTLRSSIKPDQFITHNIISGNTEIDYHDLSRNLDFISWDSYPTGYADTEGEGVYANNEETPRYSHDLGDPYITGFYHSLTRGLKQAPFWIMEQQTGAINWSHFNTGVRPGALRMWAWQAAASGADATIYFRWRASRFGLEQHHDGLLNHAGEPDTGYEDLLRIKAEHQQLVDFTSKPLDSEIGILLDYDTLWALEMQPHRQDFTYMRHLFVFYRACKMLGLEPDIVSPQADLNQYKILLSPNTFLADESLAQKLEYFTEQGGTLMLGIRAGFKDENNVVTDQPLPGVLRNLAGVQVKYWHALPPETSYLINSNVEDLQSDITFWAEALEPAEGTNSLADYAGEDFQGYSAMTEKKQGEGSVVYCGLYPRLSQAVAIVRYLAQSRNIQVMNIPDGLAVIRRGASLLAMNFTEAPIDLDVKSGAHRIPARDFSLLSV